MKISPGMKKAKITAIMKRMKWLYAIFIIAISIIPLRSVILGGIPFWYDPARDMLLAQNNLQKLTLIGPPGGIPGIFYGPYWIWLLSWPMVFSKDPRSVVLLAITIPFLILFPFILWRMKKLLGLPAIFIILALFIINYNNYLTFPWSPYLISLVILALMYLVSIRAPVILIGVVAALAPNFNFSFGIVVVFGTLVYVLLTDWKKLPKFLMGACLVYLPFFIFEVRHDFLQIRAFWDTFLNSALYNTAAVGQIGIPKSEILTRVLTVPAEMLHLPLETFGKLGIVLVVLGVIKGLLKERMVWLSGCILGSLFFIYHSTKNPIWPYQFIGVETIFLVVLGLLLSKSRMLSIIIGAWVIWLMLGILANFVNPLIPNYLALPTLASKENIARQVIADAASRPYTVFAYSPAIYTYEYDYLFGWLAKNHSTSDGLVYLIIPSTTNAIKTDFIHYKTPDNVYKTEWGKEMPDGTTIIKRVKLK
jgi:hypothetical protein